MENRSQRSDTGVRVVLTGTRCDLDVLARSIAAFAALPGVDVLALVVDGFPGERTLNAPQECAVSVLGGPEAHRLGYGSRSAELLSTSVRRTVERSLRDFNTVIAVPPRAFPVAGLAPLLDALAREPPGGRDQSVYRWWSAVRDAAGDVTHRLTAGREICGPGDATPQTGFVIVPPAASSSDLPAFLRLRYDVLRPAVMPRRYRFAWFSNGVPFDRIASELYLTALAQGMDFADPGEVDEDPSYYRWLRSPDPADRSVSRYLLAYRNDVALASTAPHPSWLDRPWDLVANDWSAASGVNVVGLLRAELGVGEAGRSMARALMRAGEPTATIDMSEASDNRSADRTLAALDDRASYRTSVLCVNPPEYQAFFNSPASAAFGNGRYRIGSWWWELPDLPRSWLEAFDQIDELWVGSRFVEAAARKVSPVPVVYVPPIVELPAVERSDRAEFGIRDDETVVLYVFDFNSIWERKNPDGAIEAFRGAFTAVDGVRLMVKTINSEKHPVEAARLSRIIGTDAHVTWLDGYLDRFGVARLIQSCDIYLSLHRAEGFGLTIAEAMLLEKPVVVTNWSGNLDYATADNSFLVDAPTVELETTYGPYTRGSRWAEPDLDHAAELLRSVVNDPYESRRRASRARYDVRTNFSAPRVAHVVRNRLNAIRHASGVS